MSRSRNNAALLRWSASLRAGAAADAVRAGQNVLAAELRRRIPDRKGRARRLASAGPLVLVTPPRVAPAGAFGSVYVGARFARQVREAITAVENAVAKEMFDELMKGAR